MGAAKVEPEPLRVTGADDDDEAVPLPLVVLLELLLEPHAASPAASAPADTTASHLRAMNCFSLRGFIMAGRLAKPRREFVTALWTGCEELVNARRP